MIARASPLLDELEATCERSPPASFADFLHGRVFGGDHDLAELIEIDARSRLDRGLTIDLGRYFEAVPKLDGLPVALDAAIEFTLRSHAGSSQPTEQAVRRLEELYPGLARPIRNAAALSAGLATTCAMRDIDSGCGRTVRVLPCDFGPELSDGRARYELRDLLGTGTQGDVYLAVDRALSDHASDAMVAVKVLADRPRTESDRWRISDEASKARRVDHPNVVRVLDRGVTDSSEEFVVYEHVAGGDLDTWFRAHAPIGSREAAMLVASIARGVQAAHSAGLVHGDLKPGNVLLTSAPGPGATAPMPKVADFGVAALLSESHRFDGEPGQRVGNLAFISPEQYRTEPGSRSVASDVYALGGMLFYLLTGELPNGATARQVAEIHAAHGGRELAPSLTASGRRIDRDLDAICRRALAPRPVDRYASADTLAADLDRWLASLPIEWARPTVHRRAALLVRRQPRLVALTVSLAAAIVLGVGSSVYVWMAQKQNVLRATMAADAATALAGVEQNHRANLSQTLRELEASAETSSSRDIPAEWFPMLSIAESLTGPYLFDPRRQSDDFLADRFEIAIDAIKAARASGPAGSLEELLWSDTLAFWLLRSGEHARAESALRHCDPLWDRLLAPDDPWRTVRETLYDVLAAEKLLAPTKGELAVVDSKAEAARVADRLRNAEQRLTDRHAGDALHRLVLRSLSRLYDGPLDDAAARRWIDDRVAELRARAKPTGEAPHAATSLGR